MSQNFLNGEDGVDLGDTVGMFASFKHFGQLSPGDEYGALHGALHAVLAEDDELSDDYLASVAEQAKKFRGEFADELTDHDEWVLGRLESAAPTSSE